MVITNNGDENQRAEETITAMEKGVEFIYHAYFVDKLFIGIWTLVCYVHNIYYTSNYIKKIPILVSSVP